LIALFAVITTGICTSILLAFYWHFASIFTAILLTLTLPFLVSFFQWWHFAFILQKNIMAFWQHFDGILKAVFLAFFALQS
jgi:hypothetical protein